MQAVNMLPYSQSYRQSSNQSLQRETTVDTRTLGTATRKQLLNTWSFVMLAHGRSRRLILKMLSGTSCRVALDRFLQLYYRGNTAAVAVTVLYSNSVSTVIQLWKSISMRTPEDGDNAFSETFGSN
jgi:hypothetical protein